MVSIMKKFGYWIPLTVLVLLTVYFLLGLGRDPQVLPSALINKPTAEFDLPAIEGKTEGFASVDLKGRVSLVNIFGSWCVACLEEHPFLMKLASQNILPIYGIDWREVNRKSGPAWLKRYGNPYTRVGDDPKSRGAIAFGVTGAPESFLTDENGIILFKHIGPLTQKIWDRQLSPIVKALQKQ